MTVKSNEFNKFDAVIEKVNRGELQAVQIDLQQIAPDLESRLRFAALLPPESDWWATQPAALKTRLIAELDLGIDQDPEAAKIQKLFKEKNTSIESLRAELLEAATSKNLIKLGLLVRQCKGLPEESRLALLTSELLFLCALSLDCFNWIIQLCPEEQIGALLNGKNPKGTTLEEYVAQELCRPLSNIVHIPSIRDRVQPSRVLAAKRRAAWGRGLLPKNAILSANIKTYGIEKAKDRLEIALLAAETDPVGVSEHIKDFDLPEETDRVAVAKVAAAHAAHQTASLISNYEIKGAKNRLAVAMIAVPGASIRCLEHFNIRDQRDHFAIAMKDARENGAVLDANRIYQYDLDVCQKGDVILEIAKKNPVEVLEEFHFGDYHEELVAVAKLAVQHSPLKTCQLLVSKHMHNIPNVRDKLDIAMLAIRSLDEASVKAFPLSGFQFQNNEDRSTARSHLRTLSCLLFEKFPREMLKQFKTKYSWSPVSVIRISPFSEQEIQLATLFEGEDLRVISSSMRQRYGARCPGLDQALDAADKQTDPHFRRSALEALFFFICKASSAEGIPPPITHNLALLPDAMAAIVEVRDPKLRLLLFCDLTEALLSEERCKQLSQAKSTGCMLLLLKLGFIELQDRKLMEDRAKSVTSYVLKDKPSEKALLWALEDLRQARELGPVALKQGLELLFGARKTSEAISRSNKLSAILKLRGVKLLNDAAEAGAILNLDDLLWAAFKQHAPFLADEAGGGEKFLNTFWKSRNPLAIVTYSACLNGLQGPIKAQVESSLQTFISAVLNDQFQEVRRNPRYNPHIKALHEQHEAILGKFHQQEKLEAAAVASPSQEPHEIKVRSILARALQQGHLTDAGLSANVKVPEQGKGLPLLQNLEEQKLEALPALDTSPLSPYLQLQRDILSLMRPNIDEETTSKLAAAISKNLKDTCEFKNDLSAILDLFKQTTSAHETVFVTDGDDPYDILLAGTEVAGSCQRIHGDSNLNRGLLGYLLNGQNRLIALKLDKNTPDTPIRGRAILRLLLDDEDKPVLLLEPIYPAALDLKYKEMILKLAKQKARRVGVPLLSVNDGDPAKPYGKKVHSRGGRASEYVDSAGGTMAGAVYSISNANIID